MFDIIGSSYFTGDPMFLSNKVIFHIDVNSAYVAWEALERLKEGEAQDLRNILSIVGGDPATRRGIVLSKSHLCKPYKIQTGESLLSALQKCPELTVVPARFGGRCLCGAGWRLRANRR